VFLLFTLTTAMKTSRLAVPANPCGDPYRRVLTSANPAGNPLSHLIASAWKRINAAFCLTGILAFAQVSALTFAWNPNPESDILRYRLSYGASPGVYPNTIDAGTSTSVSVTGLTAGTTYYFVVTAENQANLVSEQSAEISYQVPGVTPEPGVLPGVIPRTGWTLHFVDSEESNGYSATRAFDGDPTTFWHTGWTSGKTPPPHEIQINLGATQPVSGFRYLPRQDGFQIGTIADYEFYTSMDGTTWGSPAASGTFASSSSEKEVIFETTNARYVKLRSLNSVIDSPDCSVAELTVLRGGVVDPVGNRAPIAVSGSASTVEGTAVAIALGAEDADGDSLSYTIVSGPNNGTLSGEAPDLTYTPSSNFAGSDSFTFKANDGTVDSGVATVSIEVTQSPPDDDVFLVDRTGWRLHFVDSQDTSGYSATHAFDGDPDTFWHTLWKAGATPPPHEIQIDLGRVHTIHGFRYLPRQDGIRVGDIGQYEFLLSMDGVNWGDPAAAGTFVSSAGEKEVQFDERNARYVRLRSLSEANGAMHTSIAELNILGITSGNQPPGADSTSLTTVKGSPVSFVLSASDDGSAPLTFTIVASPGSGSLEGTAPDLTYIPSPGFIGTDSFTFRVNDGTSDSNIATVSISVLPKDTEPSNSAPVFLTDRIFRPAGTEKESYAGGNIAGTVEDADEDDVITFEILAGPSWLKISKSGELSGNPPAGSEGINRFDIRATDLAGDYAEAVLLIDIDSAHLPLPWEVERLGGGGRGSKASFDAGIFTLEGSGRLADSSDSGCFVWQTLTGDGSITARVTCPDDAERQSRIGLMIRDSLAANSRQVFIGMNGSGSLRWIRRSRANASSIASVVGALQAQNVWLRLVRKGETITAFKSTDGSNWIRLGSTTAVFGTNCQIGLWASCGAETGSPASFRNVSVEP
jgi:regulation of enolase protein 1 (concanavalin A-like superfamily)